MAQHEYSLTFHGLARRDRGKPCTVICRCGWEVEAEDSAQADNLHRIHAQGAKA